MVYALQCGVLISLRRIDVLRQHLSPTSRRLLSTSPAPQTSRWEYIRKRRVLLLTGVISGSAVIGVWADAKSCPDRSRDLSFRPASSPETSISIAQAQSTDLIPLLRTYVVYSLISIPFLVDHASQILDYLLRVPLVGRAVETIVRRTFFAQYVGGETVQDILPLIRRLRYENKGMLLGYSVEVDENVATAGTGHGTPKGQRSYEDASNSEQPIHKRIVEEIIHSIDTVGDFEDRLANESGIEGRGTWIAVKLTALLPRAESLRNFSMHLVHTRPEPPDSVPFPGTPSSSDLAILDRQSRSHPKSPLMEEDVRDLQELYANLRRICLRAKERRIKIVIDAEYTWYQPAIDAFGHALMEQFNKLPENVWTKWLFSGSSSQRGPQPLVYMTYQAYLRRTPAHLAHSIALSRKRGYALGVKLVRGAYHPHEIASHIRSLHTMSISTDLDPPVYSSKVETDACYNTCVSVIVRAIADDIGSSPTQLPRLGVVFGTHNWGSSELVLHELVKNGLAREEGGVNEPRTVVIPREVAERCTFAQLYGMANSLTNHIVACTRSPIPFVLKYTPYGALGEVIPYLSRRAIENKSVLGSGRATRERKEAALVIWKKLFGSVGL
ncbi:FAD-linked oxidoreductase-like protein [Pisolithus tinctorius]|nr:FAD-linked oxidoreductase-like protein [Pisolithus tinctorius]